jgi:prepilin-type N-terminal cleavage/methylation domain-containing protein
MLNAVPAFPSPHRSQAGFSLPELLIAVTILLIISSAVTSGLLQMTNSQRTIWNRTQLHAGVRSATELLQQEVGQAGRIALPGTDPTGVCAVCLAGAVLAPGAQTVSINQKINGVTVASASGMFVGERLVIHPGGIAPVPVPCIDTSPCQETVVVTAVPPTVAAGTVTATFAYPHAAGAAVQALGGFATGIVPNKKPDAITAYPNGSDGTHLKLFGDINGDGNMVYVEYTCDFTTTPGSLFRNVMPYDQTAVKGAVNGSHVLLNNILPNPGGTACFTYMPSPLPVVTDLVDLACACPTQGQAFVLDVAITLTVQTQMKDPITKDFQLETKALLNVSPRNVFNVWQLASAGIADRVQPIPPSVTALLP